AAVWREVKLEAVELACDPLGSPGLGVPSAAPSEPFKTFQFISEARKRVKPVQLPLSQRCETAFRTRRGRSCRWFHRRWPNGAVERFPGSAAGRVVLLVEGRGFEHTPGKSDGPGSSTGQTFPIIGRRLGTQGHLRRGNWSHLAPAWVGRLTCFFPIEPMGSFVIPDSLERGDPSCVSFPAYRFN